MKLKAYAKINLILDVNKKLTNGYHDISFLMTTLDLYDEVEIKKAKEDEVVVKNKQELSGESNLAYKALQQLKEQYNIKNNYKVVIQKNIPVAAGMAGGSTNAAAVIKAINEIEKLNLTKEQLIKVGLKVGADVPFCIFSTLAIVKGVGEKVEVINKTIPSSKVLMLNIGVPLSTKKVYENHNIEEIKGNKIETILEEKDYNNFYSQLRNSLQNTAFTLMPQIKELQKEITEKYLVTNVIVSGSGPTLLVFDEDINKLTDIKNKYQKLYKYVDIYTVNNNTK